MHGYFSSALIPCFSTLRASFIIIYLISSLYFTCFYMSWSNNIMALGAKDPSI